MKKADLWWQIKRNKHCPFTECPPLQLCLRVLSHPHCTSKFFSVCQTRLFQQALPLFNISNTQCPKLRLAFSGFQIFLLEIHFFLWNKFPFGHPQISSYRQKANIWTHSAGSSEQMSGRRQTGWVQLHTSLQRLHKHGLQESPAPLQSGQLFPVTCCAGSRSKTDLVGKSSSPWFNAESSITLKVCTAEPIPLKFDYFCLLFSKFLKVHFKCFTVFGQESSKQVCCQMEFL